MPVLCEVTGKLVDTPTHRLLSCEMFGECKCCGLIRSWTRQLVDVTANSSHSKLFMLLGITDKISAYCICCRDKNMKCAFLLFGFSEKWASS